MTRAVHRAGFRPLAFASRHLLLRPAALKIAASIVLTLLALGLYSLSRGSYPLPASTLARRLLAPQEMGEQPRFILFDIRLPRILMALLCGAMLGLAGAAMQSITRNGLADPGLIGVKEGASIVVLALVLFFPAVGLVSAAAGGDGRRHSGGPAGPDAVPRLFAAALYFNWHRRLLEPGGRGRHLWRPPPTYATCRRR